LILPILPLDLKNFHFKPKIETNFSPDELRIKGDLISFDPHTMGIFIVISDQKALMPFDPQLQGCFLDFESFPNLKNF